MCRAEADTLATYAEHNVFWHNLLQNATLDIERPFAFQRKMILFFFLLSFIIHFIFRIAPTVAVTLHKTQQQQR